MALEIALLGREHDRLVQDGAKHLADQGRGDQVGGAGGRRRSAARAGRRRLGRGGGPRFGSAAAAARRLASSSTSASAERSRAAGAASASAPARGAASAAGPWRRGGLAGRSGDRPPRAGPDRPRPLRGPVLGLLGQQRRGSAASSGSEIAGVPVAGRRRRRARVLRHDRHRRARERDVPGRRLVEHHPQRVQVGAEVEPLPLACSGLM